MNRLPRPRLKTRTSGRGTAWNIVFPLLGPDGRPLRYRNRNAKESSLWLEGVTTEQEALRDLAMFNAGWDARDPGAVEARPPHATGGHSSVAASPNPNPIRGSISTYIKVMWDRHHGTGKPGRQHIETEERFLLRVYERWGEDVSLYTPSNYREFLKVCVSEDVPERDRWGHTNVEKHLGAVRRWIVFAGAEGGTRIPDFAPTTVKPSHFALPAKTERLILAPDEVLALNSSARRLLNEREALLRRKATPHREARVVGARGRMMAIAHSSLAGLSYSDMRVVGETEYRDDGKRFWFGHYRKKTGVAIDVPFMGRISDLLREHVEEGSGALVCDGLSTHSASLKSLQTVVRHSEIGRDRVTWYTLRHTFGSMVRKAYSEDFAVYGRLMGHAHGSPMCLPEKLRLSKEGQQKMIGLRYDHPDEARCLEVVDSVEALLDAG